MRKMKDKTKRILAGVIAVIIVVAMVLSSVMLFFIDAYAAGTEKKSDENGFVNGFKIEGKAGIGGYYRIGALMPIEAVVENSSSGSSFIGEAEIKANISNDPNQPKYIVYSYPLELAPGASKKIEMNIAIPSIVHGIVISLTNKSGKSAASGSIPVTALNDYMPLAAVLTDDIDSMNYLKQLTFLNENSEETAIGDRLIPFDEKTFPSDAELLKNLRILFINRFDTGRLSSEQVNAIINFVSSGGLVIMGTGANAEQALSAFAGLVNVTEGFGKQSEITGFQDNYSQAETTDWNGKTLKYAPLDIPTATVHAFGIDKASGGNVPVSYDIAYGSGCIVVHCFDLSESTVSDSQSSVKLLNSIYSRFTSYPSRRSSYYYSGNSMQYLLTNLPVFNDGTTAISFIIISIYLIFIGPILYIILKKKDKRDLAWIVIPSSAVIITVIVFMLSGNSIYSKPLLNTITILDLPQNSGNATAKHSFSAFSPNKGGVTTAFSNNMPINMNHLAENNYGYNPFFNASQSTGDIVCKLKYGEEPSIMFNSGMSWSANVFQADRSMSLDGGIIADLSLTNNILSGTITNNTGYSLTDVCIVYGATSLNLGPVDDGGILNVNTQIGTPGFYGYIDSYSIASTLFSYNQATGYYTYDRDSNLKRNIIVNELNNESNNMVSSSSTTFYAYSGSTAVIGSSGPGALSMPSSARSSTQQASSLVSKQISQTSSSLNTVRIYAFCTENILNTDVKINDKTPTYVQTSLLKTTGNVGLIGTDIDLGYNHISCSEILTENGMDYYSGTDVYVYGVSDVYFLYRMPNDLNASVMQFMTYGRSYTIYNVSTEAWEILTETEYFDTENYFNEDGNIQIKYSGAANEYVTIPASRFVVTQRD